MSLAAASRKRPHHNRTKPQNYRAKTVYPLPFRQILTNHMNEKIWVFGLIGFAMIGAVFIGVKLAEIITHRSETWPYRRRLRYATYCGRQRYHGICEDVTLWNLRDARLGTRDSTVDEQWLDEAIRAHEHGLARQNPIRVVAALDRCERMVRDYPRSVGVITVAGRFFDHKREYQVQVIATSDAREFRDPIKAGVDAP